jgi:beta-lactamase class A
MRRPWLGFLAVLLACGETHEVVRGNTESTGSAALAPAEREPPPSAAASPTIPDTPAGRRLQWFLTLVNDQGGRLDETDAAAHFSAPFLASVPPKTLVTVMAQMSQGMAPLGLVALDARTATSLVATVTSQQGPLEVHVAVGAEPPHRFDGLLLRPPTSAIEPPSSWDAAKARLQAAAPRVQLLAATLGTDTCQPMQSLAADEPLAIGSTFKLYVLLAVTQAVVDGALAWDTPILVRDEHKSLPTGTLQNVAAGTTVPLEQVARQMISISDNTATDHLLYRVGRDAVERAMTRAGHRAPALNQPFLATREMFLLKLGATDELVRYLAMSRRQRRRHLDKTLAARTPTLDGAAAWTTPRHIDTLEWFASADDLCRAMLALRRTAEAPGDRARPLLAILAENPGVPVAAEHYTYVGFKGGSEPGVMNLTWLLQKRNGDWVFLTVGANHDQVAVDEAEVIAIATGALLLLAGG